MRRIRAIYDSVASIYIEMINHYKLNIGKLSPYSKDVIITYKLLESVTKRFEDITNRNNNGRIK